MLVWPASLPQRALQEGYSERTADSRLRREADRGPPKFRRGSSAAPMVVSLRFRLEVGQKQTLENFIRDDLKGGSLQFKIPGQVYDGTPLTNDAGDFLTTTGGVIIARSQKWVVQFDSLPTYDRPGLLWVASFSLLVLP